MVGARLVGFDVGVGIDDGLNVVGFGDMGCDVVGFDVGDILGLLDGYLDGLLDGYSDGMVDGYSDGLLDG